MPTSTHRDMYKPNYWVSKPMLRFFSHRDTCWHLFTSTGWWSPEGKVAVWFKNGWRMDPQWIWKHAPCFASSSSRWKGKCGHGTGLEINQLCNPALRLPGFQDSRFSDKNGAEPQTHRSPTVTDVGTNPVPLKYPQYGNLKWMDPMLKPGFRVVAIQHYRKILWLARKVSIFRPAQMPIMGPIFWHFGDDEHQNATPLTLNPKNTKSWNIWILNRKPVHTRGIFHSLSHRLRPQGILNIAVRANHRVCA